MDRSSPVTKRFCLHFPALAALAACTALVASCASSTEVLSDPLPPRAALDAGTQGPAQGFSGMDGGVTVSTGAGDAAAYGPDATLDASSSGPVATPVTVETCDGIDNDMNGVVDDLDVARDGICDCLKIATIGIAGASGDGDIFGSWLNSRSDAPVTALVGQTLTPALLGKYQILVAQDLNALDREYSDAEVRALEQWVRAGGGLMTLIGYARPSERTNANKLLAPYGVSYGETPILARSGAITVPVTGWLGPHPVVDGVSRVGVDNGYPVLGSGTALAREGGFDLLKVQEVGTGHLIVWGDEWITYDSEWASQADYQVEQLWRNALKWLTVAQVCQVPQVFI